MSTTHPDAATLDAILARASALEVRGDTRGALAAYRECLALAPSHARAHAQAGLACARLDEWGRGIAHLRAAVAAAPETAENWANLASAFQHVGLLDDAERLARQALAMRPAIASAWNTLGLVASDRGHYEEGRAHLLRALEIDPGSALARMNLGICDYRLEREDDALSNLTRALEIDSSLVPAHFNLGALHHKRGRLAQAFDHYRKAIELRPDHAQAHLNLALALFAEGRFEEAWREHAWRRQRREHAAILHDEGRPRIAVHAEQGLGDNLFFLRFAPALRARGATLDFVGDERLHPMLSRTGLFGAMARHLAALPEAERDVVLAGDLAALAPGATATTPAPLALTPDPARLAAMRARLAALGAAPYIALGWRAGEPKSGRIENLFKEVPLDALGAALHGVKATYLAIQRDPRPGEIESLARAIGAPVHDLSGVNTDLEDALALLAVVDEYVGVSSTLFHLLAGAGGKARILVPFPPEWRWMASGDASPWFPGARVYRQSSEGDWSSPLARLASDLAATRS